MINEQLVLSAILIDNRHMKKALTIIQPDDFADLRHKKIYEAMIILDNNHKDIDYTTILNQLGQNSRVDIEYLIHITDILPTAANIDTYIANLREEANVRKLKQSMKLIVANENHNSEQISEYIKGVIDGIEHIDNTTVDYVYDGIDEYMDLLADGNITDTSHKTLFKVLDETVMIQNGDYVTIAAHTGFGKSAFVMNIAKHFSMQGKKGLVVSAEMTRQQWTNRLLANISEVPNKKVQRRIELTKDDIFKLVRASKEVKKLDIMIHDKGGMTVENIVNLSNKLKRKGKLDYICVDHIALIDTTKRVSGDTERISHISKTLKQLALSLKVPVIVLSQFNRNATDPRTGKKREPVKEDLKGSGSLAEDANIIMFLYSTKDVEDFVDRFITIKVAKNRDGETAKKPMIFKADKQQFVEIDYNKETQTSTEIPLTKIGGVF